MSRNILVIGGSRGLGVALAQGVIDSYDRVWVVSRTSPDFLPNNYTWIEAYLR